MRHARTDYARFQDPDGLIGEDEPVFLLRARDLAAPAALRAWAQEVARLHVRSSYLGTARNFEEALREPIVVTVLAWADEMEKWAQEHGAKVPDAPAAAMLPPAIDADPLHQPGGFRRDEPDASLGTRPVGFGKPWHQGFEEDV